MNKILKTSILAAFVVMTILALGCVSVRTAQPLAAKSDVADRAKLEGTWLFGNKAVLIQSSSDGILHCLIVGDWNEAEHRFKTSEIEGFLAKSEKGNFISLRAKEDDKWQTEYSLLKYEIDADDMVCWLPKPQVVADAVNAHRLEGVVHYDDKTLKGVLLSGPGDAILKFLEDPANENCFDWKHPIPLHRVARSTPKE